MMYIYPENLKSKATLGLWELRNIMIIGGVLVPGIVIYARTGTMLFIIAAAVYAFLSIKLDETSILDFIKYAAAYFITDQQRFEWRRTNVKNRGGRSTAELIGISKISEHSIFSDKGEETVLFLIKPSNLSVLSEESLNTRIYGLMTVLKGVTEIGMMCLNSRESFENNKWFLKKRLEEEREPVIRQLIQRDLKDLDRIQIQMATSREFLILVRPKEKSERDKQNLLNRIEKMLAEQGFQAKLADKEDIKRILAVYFEQNVTTEKFEEFDGERWIVRK